MLGSKVMQTKTHAYPQPEGTLGDCMIRASQRLGDDSSYGEFTLILLLTEAILMHSFC